MNWRSEGALPVRRVTGKLLFPRAEIEEWIVANGGHETWQKCPGPGPATGHCRRT